MIERRDFLRAMLVAAAGPMIVRASSLMPIRALAPEIVFPAVGSWGPVHRWIVTAVTSSDGVPTGMRPLDSEIMDWTGGLKFVTCPGYKVGDIIEMEKLTPPAEASGAFEVDIKFT